MKTLHLIVLCCIAFILGLAVAYIAKPYGADWVNVYRPVTLTAYTTYNFDVYDGTWFFNPVHTLYITLPFALLSKVDGRAAWFAFCFTCYVVFAIRSGFHPLAVAAFLVNPFVIASLWDGNIDGVVLLGSVLAPWIGLPLLVIKPHMTFILVGYYAYDAYATGGPRAVAKRFLLVTALIVTNIVVHPNWIPAMLSAKDLSWNLNLWPSTILMGVYLTIRAFKYDDKFSALASGIFYSPYSSIQGWGAILALFRKNPVVLPLITCGMWLVTILLLSS
jgi:hypothetical protein